MVACDQNDASGLPAEKLGKVFGEGGWLGDPFGPVSCIQSKAIAPHIPLQANTTGVTSAIEPAQPREGEEEENTQEEQFTFKGQEIDKPLIDSTLRLDALKSSNQRRKGKRQRSRVAVPEPPADVKRSWDDMLMP